jgi:hypothetical protein
MISWGMVGMVLVSLSPAGFDCGMQQVWKVHVGMILGLATGGMYKSVGRFWL